MFPLRLGLDGIRRGRQALSLFQRLFRSASQLPFSSVRNFKLSPAQPRNRFAHLPRVFGRALAAVLPAVLLVTFLAVHFSRHSAPNHSQAGSVDLNAATRSETNPPSSTLSSRPIFPYSVVPGGVRDAQELQKVTAADPVVAKHYSDFRIAKARTVQLDRPVAMYVSYRRNNHVYWTKNRMMIPAGETLISDGENLARVRCGNRLSPVAVKPVAITEPDKETLETPEFVPPLMAELLPGEGNELFPGAPGGAVPVPPSVGPTPGGSGGPSTPILPPFLGPGVPPIGATVPPPPPPPPPVNTPEPDSLSLLFAGAVFFAVLAILSLRRNGAS
jgi:hypothetical protein